MKGLYNEQTGKEMRKEKRGSLSKRQHGKKKFKPEKKCEISESG